MTRDLLVEQATDRDIDAILDLERRGWPQAGSMQADRDRFCRRIALGGMIVARSAAGGTLVGAISTFRPRWIHSATLDELLDGCPHDLLALPVEQGWTEIRARYGLPRDWHAATDDGRLAGGALHDPDGEVVFGIGITTDPRERQRGIAQALLDGALATARRQGARIFLAYSRLPMYSLHASDTPEQYVLRTVQRDGVVKPFDFGFRLHCQAAAQCRWPLALHRDSRLDAGRRGELDLWRTRNHTAERQVGISVRGGDRRVASVAVIQFD